MLASTRLIDAVLLTPESWQQIEMGITQRATLLERVMADIYGAQQLIRQGVVAPASVQGHPGYLRALHGVTPVGGTYLHIAAFDLACDRAGQWAVVAQHIQAAGRLGDWLETRAPLSAPFPSALEALRIPHLTRSYHAWLDSLKAHSPQGAHAQVALLTPGPYHASYGKQVDLAHSLGLSLVEGSDLTVRDERLYMRTLGGREPVHALLTRISDDFLDPLELRADSLLGVPGLLQAMRAGHVVIANAPGCAFLESPAWLDFLPAISDMLLGERLRLSALDPLGGNAPDAPDTTGQGSASLRVFALRVGTNSWQVVPSDGARMAPSHARSHTLTPPPALSHRHGRLTRRGAESLYWLGRYTERCDNMVRVARLCLHILQRTDVVSPPLLTWMRQLTQRLGLASAQALSGQLPAQQPTPALFRVASERELLERALIVGLNCEPPSTTSVGFHLRTLQQTAFAVRDRVSPAHWSAVVQCVEQFHTRCPAADLTREFSGLQALHALGATHAALTAIAQTQTDHMTHDEGWQLLNIGRYLERLGFLASALDLAAEGDAWDSALLDLFDGAFLGQTPPPLSTELAPWMALLVQNQNNPQALAGVADTLRAHLAKLADIPPHKADALAHPIPDFSKASLADLCQRNEAGLYPHLHVYLAECVQAVGWVSDALTARYFSHRDDHGDSVGV